MTAEVSREMKSLQTRLTLAEQEAADALSELDKASTALSVKKQSVSNIKRQINDLKESQRTDIIVSEHAILRLLERIYGVNVEEAVEQIKKNALAGNIANGRVKCSDGYTVVIKNRTVVTIEP